MPNNNPRVRIYVKKQIQIANLNFNQRQMLKLGTVAVANVKSRVQDALQSDDSKAKPLNKAYAITKSKRTGRRAFRDLTNTGDMLRNFQVRTVSQNAAYASNTTVRDRQKARSNNAIEMKYRGGQFGWIAHSPKNIAATIASAQRIFAEGIPNFIKVSWSGPKRS